MRHHVAVQGSWLIKLLQNCRINTYNNFFKDMLSHGHFLWFPHDAHPPHLTPHPAFDIASNFKTTKRYGEATLMAFGTARAALADEGRPGAMSVSPSAGIGVTNAAKRSRTWAARLLHRHGDSMRSVRPAGSRHQRLLSSKSDKERIRQWVSELPRGGEEMRVGVRVGQLQGTEDQDGPGTAQTNQLQNIQTFHDPYGNVMKPHGQN